MPEKYLYLLLYPNHSLIASQLTAADFAKHYAQGSTSFLGSNFLFVEIDSSFRNPYFRIDKVFEEIKPHEDGTPKATKFISNYRTLEHIDFNYLKNVYFCNAMGDFVELVSGECDSTVRGDEMRILLDMNPTKIVALTRHNFAEYGYLSTDPESFVGVPTILYTQIDFDIDNFLIQFSENPFMPLRLPGVHPARLRDSILELRQKPNKMNKGLSLNCPLDKISYKSLRRGFMFARREEKKFYPLLSIDDVEKNFYRFWKSL